MIVSIMRPISISLYFDGTTPVFARKETDWTACGAINLHGSNNEVGSEGAVALADGKTRASGFTGSGVKTLESSTVRGRGAGEKLQSNIAA